MTAIPRPEHPRPDFERDNWLCLNGLWEFSIDEPVFDRRILVPFACETALSGVQETGFHKKVFYRRRVEIPASMRGLRLLLHFGAVDYACRVMVNGRLVATHQGGQTPFQADVTDEAAGADSFELRVDVEDDPQDLEAPRGKQFWEERQRSIFYDRTTGIWQTVWLEAAEPLHLQSCRITPVFDLRAVKFDYILSDREPCQLEIALRFEGKPAGTLITEARGSGGAQLELDQQTLQKWNFAEELSWSPENPRLFEVEYTLRREGRVCDRVRSYFGMRKVSIENGVFCLNNRPYYQKLALDQGYWPESLLTAPDDEALIRDIRLTKSMGFNGVRKHQKVEDPRYLYHADRLGLLVWGEIGSAYLYSVTSARRLAEEWQEAVCRDYNHPCIVAWTPLNESWGVEQIAVDKAQQAFSTALVQLTKSLDQTRPVICNDGWEHTDGDLFTIHDYASEGATLAKRYQNLEELIRLRPCGRRLLAEGFSYRNQPVIVSEYGGVKYVPRQDSEDSWGYCEAESGEQYERKLRELTEALQRASAVQGYCYTQLTDVGTEENGLLTAWRQPKIPLEAVRAINETLG